MRVGVFGGSFNPPHLGHCIVAEWAADRLALDRVLWVPARRSPLKSGTGLASDGHRMAMVRLITDPHPGFDCSDVELTRDPPSYTVDTLRALHAEHPDWDLHLLIGGDSLRSFHAWREPDALMALATVCTYPRADDGTRPDGGMVQGPDDARVVHLDAPPIGISSSLVRARIAGGRSIRYLVPDAVADYVRTHGLYGP